MKGGEKDKKKEQMRIKEVIEEETKEDRKIVKERERGKRKRKEII